MAKPRNPETAEIIRMLGEKRSVRDVAESLDVDRKTVENAYYRYYDEIVELQRSNARREKAEEIAERMKARGVGNQEAPEPANRAPQRSVETPMPAPAAQGESTADGIHKKGTAADISGLIDAEGSRASDAHSEKGRSADVGSMSGPLRVYGYIGGCGRTYILRGRTVEIGGLADRFTKEDLRSLSNEILEIAGILDRKEGATA